MDELALDFHIFVIRNGVFVFCGRGHGLRCFLLNRATAGGKGETEKECKKGKAKSDRHNLPVSKTIGYQPFKGPWPFTQGFFLSLGPPPSIDGTVIAKATGAWCTRLCGDKGFGVALKLAGAEIREFL